MPETDPKAGGTNARTDYAAMYREYWARDDRWGTHSFKDADAIVEQILSTCGGGPILDVGCGMGLLVRSLVRKGVDARGVDIAEAPIEEANRIASGRFEVGSILAIPRADGEFQTVICTDLLEHVAERDVPRALSELYRVCSRFCYVRLSVEPDRDNRWHLTVRERDWWLQRFFEAGFSRHPLAQSVVPYDAMRGEGWQITLVLEKAGSHGVCPAGSPMHGAFARDITQETGDDAERAIAMVVLASRFVASRDRVLDASRGVGWSASMLGACTPASEILGVVREGAEEWASDRFGSDRVRFVESARLDLGNERFGTIVALGRYRETDDLNRDLESLAKALDPGGRLIVDLPGAVSGDSLALDRQGMLVDSVYTMDDPISSADGAGSLLRRVQSADAPETAQRTVLVLMRDPVGATSQGYVERVFPEHLDKQGFHIANYARDLDNPWLLRAMVSVGMRGSNPDLNAHIAQSTLESARAGSSDEGAALCVLAYRVLDADTIDPERATDLIARIETYHTRADQTPYAWRWRISNQYAGGLLHLALGQLDRAREAFIACAGMDPTPYSPLLASKTVDAWFRAGLIDASAGRSDQARHCWTQSLLALERAIKSDWLNVWGSPEEPLSFAMADLAILVDLGSRSAAALGSLKDWSDRPGPAWTNAHRQTLADMRRGMDRLERSRDWMDSQRVWLRGTIENRDETIEQLRTRIENLESTKTRLEETREHLLERQRLMAARDQQLADRVGDMRDKLDRAGEHADRQRERIDELREATRRLSEAREFLRSQIVSRDARLEAARHGEIARKENQAWHEHRLRAQEERFAEVERYLQDRIARIETQIKAVRQGSEFWKARFDETRLAGVQAREQMTLQLAKKDETIAQLRARLDQKGGPSRPRNDRKGEGSGNRSGGGSDTPSTKAPVDGPTIAPKKLSERVDRVHDPAQGLAKDGPDSDEQAGGTDS